MTKKIMISGYMIVDTSNEPPDAMFHTLRSNRTDCWNAMCSKDARDEFKRYGYKCVYVRGGCKYQLKEGKTQ